MSDAGDDDASPGASESSASRDDPSPPDREAWREQTGEGSPPPRRTDDDEPGEWLVFLRDIVTSVLSVALVGMFLFAASGVWPPLVAVESDSMVPNMQVNDLVFVMEADRFPGDGAHEPTGVVTARQGQRTGHTTFGQPGDVVVYEPDGDERTTPIIHRAMFWVEAGENWADKADPTYLPGSRRCELDSDPDTDTGIRNCPAPHAGFITKGDANGGYDQTGGVLSGPVKPEWIVGTAEVRVPGLGWIRLQSQ
jgi:signal peptidase